MILKSFGLNSSPLIHNAMPAAFLAKSALCFALAVRAKECPQRGQLRAESVLPHAILPGQPQEQLDERGLRADDPKRRPATISFDGLNDDPAAWQFAQYKPTPHHAMAIAIRCGVGKKLKIRLRKIGPSLASY